MSLVQLGWSHRARPACAREALAAVPAQRVLAELRGLGAPEAAVLSTCNRFELYAELPAAGGPGAEDILAALERLAGAPLAAAAETRAEAEAAAHLFAVAAGLDSLVVGESEILGQVRGAYDLAKSAGMTGKLLNVLFQRALYVGKRVRSETAVGRGASSVPSVAVQLAESIFGKLEGKSALVVGAGAMAELAAKHIMARGAGGLAVVNRTWERAYQLAVRFGGEAARWEDLEGALGRADIVVCSTGAPSAVLTREMVARAMPRREGKSLFIMDIAMPRDVEESVHSLDSVYLYRLEDLESIVASNMAGRAEAVAAARRIVEEKAAEFSGWTRSLAEGRELSLRHSGRPRG